MEENMEEPSIVITKIEKVKLVDKSVIDLGKPYTPTKHRLRFGIPIPTRYGLRFGRRVVISIKMPDSMVKELNNLANIYKTSRSRLINSAVALMIRSLIYNDDKRVEIASVVKLHDPVTSGPEIANNVVTLKMYEGMIEELDSLAEQLNTSRASLIRGAIMILLTKMKYLEGEQ